MLRIVHNKLLGGWYIVRGKHQAPIGGRFNSRAEAQAWLDNRKAPQPAQDNWPDTGIAMRWKD